MSKYELAQVTCCALLEGSTLPQLYRWESILAIRCPSQTQNNVVKYYVLQFTCKI
jgi:hypothetical protein